MKHNFDHKENYTVISYRLIVGLALVLLSELSLAANPAQVPLFLLRPAKANVMLMLDNSGSMNNIVPDAPYDPNTVYNCPAANQIPACNTFGCVQIRINGGVPLIYNGITGATYTLGKGAGQKCFNSAGQYNALLIADNAAHTAPSFLTGDAKYTGNYLNWYFDASNTGSWGNGTQKPGTKSRLEVTKQSATDLVDSLDNVRLGLSTYYNLQDGGQLLETIEDVDNNPGKKSEINTKINNLKPENNTPLAEALLDIGRYFAEGNSGNLTLHPGKSNQTTASVSNVFTQGGVADHQLINNSGKTVVSPIENSCQKNFAVLMTDGRPHLDRDLNDQVRDYSGDCAAGLCDSTPTPNPTATTPFTCPDAINTNPALPPTALTSICHKNGTKIGRVYEWGGSDYLDDVAQALFEMDLRPDLTKSKVGEKSNLLTYIIGFADPILANDPLLIDTAKRGGSDRYYTAGNSGALNTAFKKIFEDIANQVELSSASSLSANSTRLDTNTKIYQAGFSSADWTGVFRAYHLRTVTEDTNGNGVKDSGEDTNGNGLLDGVGSLGDKTWDMSFPSSSNRRILTYNPVAVGAKGISFEWTELSAAQQTALTGVNVLNYIRGDSTNEKSNGGTFRDRRSMLGDIVNSDPWFVGKTENFGYGLLPGAEGTSYQKFRNDPTYSNFKGDRTDTIYFGANDGMLHAVNAQTGAELFAYVPNAVIPSLNNLTLEKYGCTQSGCEPHAYFVDGSPRAGDAYFGGVWHTVLLGSTGAGSGKAVFALDITKPSASMSSNNVLWEISPNQAPFSTNLADDTTNNNPGFTNNLGYSIPQPAIVRMKNGKWAAIVANGYSSASNKAVLFIIDVATGAIIRSLDTKVGSTSTPNGLSTPISIDSDGDHIVDAIYAGDLLGNLWKFDVSSDNASNWQVAFSSGSPAQPKPLYTACSGSTCDGTNYQPITAKPQVGRHPEGGLMIYFGTGKYFEPGDHVIPPSPQTQTFYGLRDNGNVIAGRANLQKQEILSEEAFDTDGNNINDVVFRGTTDSVVDYLGNSSASPVVPAKKGWYMDLLSPVGGAKGERVVTSAITLGSRIMFFTITPYGGSCKAGGYSWLMNLDALNGKRLMDASLDTNDDGFINADDKKIIVDTNGDGVVNSSDYGISVAGSKHLDADGNEEGMIDGAAIVRIDSGKVRINTGDSIGKINGVNSGTDDLTGRQSWRQVR
jgi:type IV pilus assembly protein PilY1